MISQTEPAPKVFITIDDAIALVHELAELLHRLGEYKHPLSVRKGVKVLEQTQGTSRTIKAGAKTYFFDRKETKEGKPYLLITESRFKGEGKDHERASIIVFQEHAHEFLAAAQKMLKALE